MRNLTGERGREAGFRIDFRREMRPHEGQYDCGGLFVKSLKKHLLAEKILPRAEQAGVFGDIARNTGKEGRP
jgi:hypothetical protein